MAGNTLDTFLPNVQTQDTRKRLQVHPELVAFLKDPESSLYCEEMDRLVDALSAWINSSNFKVSPSILIPSFYKYRSSLWLTAQLLNFDYDMENA